MDISSIRALLAEDLKAVDSMILHRLETDVALINQIGHYIINSGGKRLRPMIVLLAAHSLDYRGNAHIDLAAVIEFIHTATLLHDDVVDNSSQRRDNDTANEIWGNASSVLVGDFLYSRAFEMMVSVQKMRVMDIMSQSTNRIAEGEVLQLLNCNDPATTIQRYMEVIDRKTATLFKASAQLGAILSDAAAEEEIALADYGLHLGMAFQLIDDALDYGSSNQDIGKNVGDDLAEGKPTLPIIRAIQTGTEAQKKLLRDAIENGGGGNIDEIIAIVAQTDAFEYTNMIANKEVEKAKKALKRIAPSAYRTAMLALADFAVSRSY